MTHLEHDDMLHPQIPLHELQPFRPPRIDETPRLVLEQLVLHEPLEVFEEVEFGFEVVVVREGGDGVVSTVEGGGGFGRFPGGEPVEVSAREGSGGEEE